MTHRSTGQQPGARRRRRRAPAGRYALAGLLALALHVLGVGLVVLADVVVKRYPGLAPPPRPAAPRPSQPVSMRPLSVEDWERNRQVRSPDAPTDAESPLAEEAEVVLRPKPPEKRNTLPGENVSGIKANDEDPGDSRWVSERNNRVEKETTAREKAQRWDNASQQRTAPVAREGVRQGQAARAAIAGNDGRGQDDQKAGAKQAPGAFELPDMRKRDQVALRPTEPQADGLGPSVSNRAASQELKGNSDRLRVVPGPTQGQDVPGGAGRRGAPGLANLLPSQAAMDQIAGVAPSDHDDRDLEEGDVTALNTREFIGSSFYSRMQRSISHTYNGQAEVAKRDPTGEIYAGRVRTTVLAVELDAEGKLKQARVERSSGLGFLDLEAVRAFEKAQPFPNPPQAIVDKDGAIRFQFAFIFDFGGGPRLRMFRQAN